MFCVFRLCFVLLLMVSFCSPAFFGEVGVLATSSALRAGVTGWAPQTPADELLKTLDLLTVSPISVEKLNEDYVVKRIQIVQPLALGKIPLGHEILYTQLGGTLYFDLLYSKKANQEKLIAVFPVIKEKKERMLYYLNLSAYQVDFKTLQLPLDFEKWRAFVKEWQAHQQAILDYLNKTSLYVYPLGSDQEALIYVEVDKKTHQFEIGVFSPDQAETFRVAGQESGLLFRENEEKDRILFPLCPTVYPLNRYQYFDREYHQTILQGFKDVQTVKKIQPGDLCYVVGPGSGIDCWLTYLMCRNKIYTSGINPFEVANAKIMAAIGNFPIEARVGDNILDEKNQPLFEARFDWLLWDMPVLTQSSRGMGKIVYLTEWWDGNFTLADLLQFVYGATRVLKPKGRALLWNKRDYLGGDRSLLTIQAFFERAHFNVEVSPILFAGSLTGYDIYLAEKRGETRFDFPDIGFESYRFDVAT